MNGPINSGRVRALDEMIETIDEQIAMALEKSFDEVVLLLRMTKLALQMKRHRISNDDLKAFSKALRDRVVTAPEKANRRSIDESSADLRPRVMLGVDTDMPSEMQRRASLHFRALDRRISQKRARRAAARARVTTTILSNEVR